MASGVNVKMGVSGVAQFKNNMNQAKNAVKTLDAQLALSEKQFKASGDAEGYMTEKTELLKAKLEQQKSVVSNAEKALENMTRNGVDRSSAAYQSLYQQMLKAKGEMLDTENAMNGVAESGDEAAKSVDSMNQQLARIGNGVSWENVTDGLGKITDGMAKVIKKAWEVGEAIVKATLGAGSWADELKTTAARYGITTTELQQWRKTANLIDTDVDTILTAQDKLKKGREQHGTEYMGALAYLGIDPNGMNDMDLFWAAGDAIAKLGKEEDKVTYAQQLFGKSWRELLPLFQAGREEWDRTNASWSVVEEDQIDGLGRMDDAYQKMQGEWETFKNELLSAFSGPLTEGMDAITGLFKELNNYLDTPEGKEMLRQMGETISGLISDLTKVDPEQVVSGLKSVIEGITTSLQWIDEHQEDVKTALVVIAGGFAALKLAEAALNIGKVVDGFKTLWGGANKPLPSVPGAETAGTGTAAAAGKSGLLAGLKSGIASNGFSLLTPAAVVAAAITPALIAQNADEKRWAEQKARRQAAAGNLTGGDRDFVLAAAAALDQHYRLTGDSASALMGLQSRGTIEKARLMSMLSGQATSYGNYATDELLRFWESGGEGWDQARTDALLTTITDSYTKMSEATDAITGGADSQKQSSSEMTSAAGTLKGLPGVMESAIVTGMSKIKIYVDGQQVGSAVSPYVNSAMAGVLMNTGVRG